MTSTVYIVCSGERGEGHDPVAVYRGFGDAVAHLRRMVTDAEAMPAESSSGRWMFTANTTDEVWIYRMTIREMTGGVPKPRGICGVCGEERALRNDGRMRGHDRRIGRHVYSCDGSGLEPWKVLP